MTYLQRLEAFFQLLLIEQEDARRDAKEVEVVALLVAQHLQHPRSFVFRGLAKQREALRL